jgi:hypothetical protein
MAMEVKRLQSAKKERKGRKVRLALKQRGGIEEQKKQNRKASKKASFAQ